MGAHVFQKNVYSVFRYNPPSIGFAALSDIALAQNGLNNVPLPSIGVALRAPRLTEILLGIIFALVSL